jgi:GNAT superfamily N-acetyltransferase
VKIVPEVRYVRGPLTETLRMVLAEGEADPSGVADTGLVFVPKEHFAIAFEGEEPVASAGWLPRTMRAGGAAIAVAALGGVLVRRSRRGRGLARMAVEAALAHARAAGHTRALLLCKPELQPLWTHFGWAEIRDRVTYAGPGGATREWPLVAMTRPLGEEAWPPGDVDLGGPPF